MTAFDDLSLAKLRGRSSAKWTTYPPDVLPAWVAEMDFPLAEPIKQRLRRAIDADDCGYAHPTALPEAFAAFAKARFDWTVDPSRVRSAPEVMIAIAEILRIVTKPGDGVVINRPVYPPFTMVIEEVGCEVVDAPLAHVQGGGWDLDLDALEEAFASGAKAYVLCNPHNPVGRVFEKAQLEAIAKLAKQHDVVVLADEIHGPLVLPGAAHVPFVSVSEPLGADAITITSASKAFNIAGLKCAVFVAGSQAMQSAMKKLPIELPERVGLHGMLANIVAFQEGAHYLDALLAHLDRNRMLMTELLGVYLPAVRYIPPQAGYLAWLDCSALGLGDDPAKVFLKKGKVALMRGLDFGRQGACFTRVNMGTSSAILSEVVGRMRKALEHD
ncbi:MAG TPA: aminotransferase class I/II-fold pyridoxal phosphate-dependent enzyme [Gemmatimonadaceae bacterium]|nr:aminotransferase class I/II-fold pyridoxal phosphate-dependent enzyme [Gemmatimonadaceae bacterium]